VEPDGRQWLASLIRSDHLPCSRVDLFDLLPFLRSKYRARSRVCVCVYACVCVWVGGGYVLDRATLNSSLAVRIRSSIAQSSLWIGLENVAADHTWCCHLHRVRRQSAHRLCLSECKSMSVMASKPGKSDATLPWPLRICRRLEQQTSSVSHRRRLAQTSCTMSCEPPVRVVRYSFPAERKQNNRPGSDCVCRALGALRAHRRCLRLQWSVCPDHSKGA